MLEKFTELKSKLHELSVLRSLNSLLQWDQATGMPPAGAAFRGQEMAYTEKARHEKLCSPDLQKLVDELSPWAESLGRESVEARMLEALRRDIFLAVKLPKAFVGELSEHQSYTYNLWTKAKAENDFTRVRPALEKTLVMSRQMAEFYGYQDHPADPLLDMAEPGMRVASLRPMLEKLGQDLTVLLKKIAATNVKRAFPRGLYPKAQQLKFSRQVIQELGYNFQLGRLDESPHPFMTRFHAGDVRITTRVFEDDIQQCLFGCIHETGHALYEMGFDPQFNDTPLSDGTSVGMHESQSRLWENMVGRSYAFWQRSYPAFQKLFPEQLADFPLEHFYQAINQVRPSLIRTESDEVTYNLHVLVRFELECEMLEGALEVADLPKAWGDKYEKYLGTRPASDSEGCMQDMHWYIGFIGGYFQGYTLGNMYSAQFFETFLKEHPTFYEAEVSKGNYKSLNEWLRVNIHQHGRRYYPDELVKRVTGRELSTQPLLKYLEKKYLDPRLAK